MKAVVLGVGMVPFRKMPERTLAGVGGDAVIAALRDACLGATDVEAAYCGNVLYGGGAGQAVLAGLGITGPPIINVENACASGGTAFMEAVHAVQSGRVEVALAIGVEMLTHAGGGLIVSARPDISAQVGLPLPGLYALKAQRFLSERGGTREQLAAVVVKNRQNAVTNEHAYFHSAVTVEEVLASAPVSDPLTLFQCCPNVDGAAAAVVVSEEFARRHSPEFTIVVAGMGAASGHRIDVQEELPDITERAAEMAYEQAGVGPTDIDVCEVHEPFSIAEILHYESLGFCDPGEGGNYVASGRASLVGDGVAVNTSGGLIARGHPLGASGVAQIFEIVTQLRGRAGGRQRAGARVGMTHIAGGTIPELDGNAAVVTVLMRQ